MTRYVRPKLDLSFILVPVSHSVCNSRVLDMCSILLTSMYTPCLFNSLKSKTHTCIPEIWKKTTAVTLMEKLLPGATPPTARWGGNTVTSRPVIPPHHCQNFPIPQVRVGHARSLRALLLCSRLCSRGLFTACQCVGPLLHVVSCCESECRLHAFNYGVFNLVSVSRALENLTFCCCAQNVFVFVFS